MCGWGRRFAAPSHTKSPSSLRVFERSEASAAVGSTVRRTGGVEGGGGCCQARGLRGGVSCGSFFRR